MSLLNTVDTLIESKVLTDDIERKLYDEAYRYRSKVIELCIIALAFNDYSDLDIVFYKAIRENQDKIFENLVTSIMITHSVEMTLTIYKLFKSEIVKPIGKNIHQRLYLTKLFDPLVSDELNKFYIKWKLNKMHVDL